MSASQKEKSEKGESNSESATHDCKRFLLPSSRASEKRNLEKFYRTAVANAKSTRAKVLRLRFLRHQTDCAGSEHRYQKWKYIARHRIIADAVSRIGHKADAKDAETDQRQLDRKTVPRQSPASYHQKEKRPGAHGQETPMPDEYVMECPIQGGLCDRWVEDMQSL